MERRVSTISRAAARRTQGTVYDQFVNMVRNEYFMPWWKNSKHILTGAWMANCREGVYWIPKCPDIIYK